jgi:DNA invertase Pin-like site-specific DNA recombinase
MNLYVAYYRSNKPMAAQRAAFKRFVEFNEGTAIADYTERETRKQTAKRQWPALERAIAHAQSGATLVIAKIGRLSRNMAFTKFLLEAGVEFVSLDNELANSQTIHIMAATAKEEAKRISQRTKDGLAVARKRGVKFGSARPDHWKGREHLRRTLDAQKAAVKKKREVTKAAYAVLMPEIKVRRERGDTLPEIVEWLNLTGRTTTVGMPFTQTAVWRLIDRYLGKEYLGRSPRGEKRIRQGWRQWRERVAS